MFSTGFPVIDPVATGENIRRMRMERGMTVKDLQSYFGFEEPRAIYKWQKGESLPSVDNLYALGKLFNVSMDQILIPVTAQLHRFGEQQAEPCCSNFLNACRLLLYLHLAQMSKLRKEDPGWTIVFRHIRDIDGHFVTRDEYFSRKSKN